jgi:hypothetical protein
MFLMALKLVSVIKIESGIIFFSAVLKDNSNGFSKSCLPLIKLLLYLNFFSVFLSVLATEFGGDFFLDMHIIECLYF